MKRDPAEKARKFADENPITAEATGVAELLRAYDRLRKENERLKEYEFRYKDLCK